MKAINTTWLVFALDSVDYVHHVRDFRKQHKKYSAVVATKME
jgi:hypothetical protein